MYFNTTFLIIYRYDPTDDTWTELPPMNIARVLAGSVVYKDKIYVIGNCLLNMLYKFNIIEKIKEINLCVWYFV